MSQLKKLSLLGLLLSLTVWAMLLPAAAAQTPRPTPTNDAYPGPDPTATATPVVTAVPGPGEPSASGEHGTIQGAVYQDVNGDGQCVNSGVEGEGPVAGIDIKFVSSDAQTIITLYTGEDGRYGLAAAGFSYWEVTAVPNSDWVVTSEPTLYVPIYADSRVATDVNFCVQTAQAAQVLLPASGGRVGTGVLNWALGIGLLFIIIGLSIIMRKPSRRAGTPRPQ